MVLQDLVSSFLLSGSDHSGIECLNWLIWALYLRVKLWRIAVCKFIEWSVKPARYRWSEVELSNKRSFICDYKQSNSSHTKFCEPSTVVTSRTRIAAICPTHPRFLRTLDHRPVSCFRWQLCSEVLIDDRRDLPSYMNRWTQDFQLA